ncbi:MAG: immunoglobulin domain-containing protein [Candidatus Didemnitutus sp.]|nr:immunoglobulin domain-containing protein [Candidatus Didemnitutus sp.]
MKVLRITALVAIAVALAVGWRVFSHRQLPAKASAGSAVAQDAPVRATPVAAGAAATAAPATAGADLPAIFGVRGPVTLDEVPTGRFREQLGKLKPAARVQALAALGRLRVPYLDVGSLATDANGQLYYECQRELAAAAVEQTSLPAASAALTVPPTPPIRHSRPGASRVLYLDFNGHDVTGTAWNEANPSANRPAIGTYACRPYDTDGNEATFSSTEQAQIVEIWQRVADDYSPFDVDVTTEEPAAFTATTLRALITRTVDANGVANPSSTTAAGVAYIDVYGRNDVAWYSPAFVYFDSLSGPASVAEAVSHELGHNLALSHDGTTTAQYYGGHGTGEFSWGPIMGAPYSRSITQWSKGEYYAANNPQDDLALIGARLTLRGDAAGASLATATDAPTTGNDVSAAGVLLSANESRFHRVVTAAGRIGFSVSPVAYGNTDLRLELLNSSGTVIALDDPATTRIGGVFTGVPVPAGIYYLKVTASGMGTPLANPPSGYTSYGSVGRYALAGTVVATAPVITSSSVGSAAVGHPITYQTTTAGYASAFAADGLPPGVAIDPTTGILSGRPTTTGVFSITLRATNDIGTGTATLTLTVNAAAPALTTASAPATVLAPGESTTLSVSGFSVNGAVAYQWFCNGRPIAGATSATYDVSGAAQRGFAAYWVTLTNTIGTTRSAPFFVNTAPAITRVRAWGAASASSQTTIPAGLNRVVAVAAGSGHSAALKADGTIVSWGSTGVAPAVSDAVAIAAGYDFTAALRRDGTVVIGGSANMGANVPSVPANLRDVVAIAAGNYHVVALKSDGTVVSWGSASSSVLSPPAGLSGVVAIAAGTSNSLALKSDGSVVSWGSANAAPPVALTGVKSIATGNGNALALKAGGTTVGWGSNVVAAPSMFDDRSQLALDAVGAFAVGPDGRLTAWATSGTGGTPPADLGPVWGLSANSYHAIAVCDAAADTAPTIAAPPQSATRGLGAPHTLRVTATGPGVFSYQWRKDGTAIPGATSTTLVFNSLQPADAGAYDVIVGNHVGSTTSAAAVLTIENPPFVTAAPPRINEAVVGAPLTLAVNVTAANGPLSYQWFRDNRAIPGATSPTYSLPSFTAADAGAYVLESTDAHGVVVRTLTFVRPAFGPTQLEVWGNSSYGLKNVPPTLGDAVAFRIGSSLAVAVRANGALALWGESATTAAKTFAASVTDAVAAAPLDNGFVVLRSDGRVVTWRSSGGATVEPYLDVIAIAASDGFAAALLADGTVRTWGGSYAPTVPVELAGVTAISAGATHLLALKLDGTVVALGGNNYGQATVPANLANVVAIAAGNYHSLALVSGGAVVSWGNGTSVPADLPAIGAIAAGYNLSLGLRVDGSLALWGTTSSDYLTFPANLSGIVAVGAGSSVPGLLRRASADSGPVVVQQPNAVVTAAGEHVRFTVRATGTAPLNYTWRKNGVATGVTAPVFDQLNVQASDAGSYDVVVSNHVGSVTSAAAALSIVTPPTVTAAPPQRVLAQPGGYVRLGVTATTAHGPLAYQWKKNNRPISGATAPNLTFRQATPADAGAYTVEVTDALGAVSRATTFLVLDPGPTQVRTDYSYLTDIPATLGDALAVRTGYLTAVALRRDGTLVGWGANFVGGLPTSTVPFVDVRPLDYAGLALGADGKIATWADSPYSTLGNPPATLNSLVAIDAARGSSIIYALRSDGRVYSWDYYGNVVMLREPTLPVTAIAVGTSHLLMLQIDGTVVASGSNYEGETIVPAGLTGVVAIAAGNDFSLALKADGTVVQWGSTVNNGQFKPPAWLTDVVALDARDSRANALRADGSVVGWGSGGASVLSSVGPALTVTSAGNYSSNVVWLRRSTGDALPTITTQPSAPSVMTAGDTLTLRVAANGPGNLAYQWRRNGTPISGVTAATYTLSPIELAATGDYDVVVSNHVGSVTSNRVPVNVLAPPAITGTPVRRIIASVGAPVTLAFTASSANGPLTYQWKKNNRPITGATAAAYALSSVTRVDAGAYTLEITDARGVVTRATTFVLVPGATAVRAWGANDTGQTDVPAGLDDVVAVAAGGSGNLALRGNGAVVAWGRYSSYGSAITVPTDLGEAVAIATSGDYAAVLRSDGTVRTWGAGYTSLPVSARVRGAISIALGSGQASALLSDGSVVTWSLSTGAVVDMGPFGVSGVVALARGYEHVLALQADGSVRGWAASTYSSSVNAASVPANLSQVSAISAGGYQSVALKADGSIVAWGDNSANVAIGPGGASAIASGSNSSAALLTNGKLRVWTTNGSIALTTVPADLGVVVGFVVGGSHALAMLDRSSLSLPVITQQPAAATVAAGDSAIFRVAATGVAPLSYQWRKDGVAIAGATGAAMVLASAQVADVGTYDVVVSNLAGSVTSQGAALTLAEGPQITSAPARRLVVASGAPTTLTVAASSPFGPLTYRWKKNNRPIAGATSATLALPSFTDDQAGAYTVEVIDSRGVVSRATSFVLAARSNTQFLAFGDVPANLAAVPADAGNSLVSLAAGSSHAVALRADGTVVAWGSNTSLQTNVPSGLANVVAVAANGTSSMALKSDGTVATWGRSYAAVETVPGLSEVIAIATCESHHLALRANGTVVAWTRSDVADPIQTPGNLPALLAGLADVSAIAAYSGYSAAVKADGTAVVWGASSNDSRVTGAAGQSGLVKVALSSTTALGLRADGTIVGWGSGSYVLPVPTSLPPARDLGLGYYHGVVLKADGTVTGWGHSTYAQPSGQADVTGAFAIALADFRTLILREGPSDAAPTIVTAPVSALVAAGTDATFTVVASGIGPIRYQWRRNGTPIAGATAASLTIPAATAVDNASYDVVVSNHVGSTTSTAATLTVVTPPNFATMPAARQVVTIGQPATLSFTLAGDTTGLVYRWYFNTQLIAGANGPSYAIPSVTTASAGAYTLTVTNPQGLTVRRTSFVLLDRGPTRVRAWGNSDYGQLAVPAALGDAIAISAGSTHGLALRRDGTVAAWGGSNSSAASVPANVADVVAVAAGASHSLALRSDGTVLTWGGGGSAPSGLRDVIAIAAGDNRSIALKSDGTVVTWEYSSSSTTPPAGVTNVVAIAAGATQFLALRANGTVAAWSNGTTYNNETNVPAGLAGVAAITAGGNTSAALGADGKVTIWGSGASNLAIGNTEATAIDCGSNYGLLRLRDGSFLSWGDTSSGARNLPTDLGLVHEFAAGGNFALALCGAVGDTAPVITTQPQGALAALGGKVTFSASATGSGTLSYQWRRNGLAVSGATSPTLRINITDASVAGAYELVVTNYVGSVTSAPAVLTLAPAPVFTTRPTPRLTPTLGQPVTLTGNATSATGPIAYRWKKNNRPIPGATSATFSLAAFTNADAGAYTLEATDANGLVGRATTFLLPDYGRTEVVAWGNTSGTGPVPAGLDNVVAVAPGYYQGAVLRRDGTVAVWSAQSSSARNVPAGLADVVALSSGSEYTLALKADGTVTAWGYASYGQTTVPAGLTDVISVLAADGNAFAIKSDGTIVVWGDSSSAVSKVPDAVTDVCALAVSSHALALRADGTVMAWGANSSGQATVPAGLTGVAAVSVGDYHSLVLREDGTAVTWGALTSAELALPYDLGGVLSISARSNLSAAIKADGNPIVWGSNSYGVNAPPANLGGFVALALGRNSNVLAARTAGADALPVITAQPQSAYAARGGAHTLSVTATSARPLSYQWRRAGTVIAGATAATLELTALTDAASGDYDVLVSNPAGTVTSAVATLTVTTPPTVVTAPAARVVVSPGAPLTLSATATSANGPLSYQWRRNNCLLPGANSGTFSLGSFTSADAGAYTLEISDARGVLTRVTSFVLAARGRTQLRAWGASPATSLPIAVSDAIAVAAGSYHSLALRADGTVLAWGSYTTDAYAVPSDLRDVVAIAAGDGFSLALRQDGTVRAWQNSYSSTTPSAFVPALTNVIAIAAGETAVALCSDGRVVSWHPLASSTVFSVPPSAKGAVAVCAGDYQAMALRLDGTVVAWLTSNSTVNLPSLGDVASIAAGGGLYAAIKSDGTLVTWGSYASGAPASAVAVSCSDTFGIAQLPDGTLRSFGSSGGSGETTVPADLGVVLGFDTGADHVVVLRDANADAPPTLTAEPQSATRAIGASYTFSVVATGAAPLSYQWFKDGVAIAGATSASLPFEKVATTDAGAYSVVVSNIAGSRRSVAATLTVLAPPAVTSRPAARTAAPLGQPLSLGVTVTTANGSLSYQWKKGMRPIVGATSATLNLASFTFADAGAYTLEATDSLGLVTHVTTFVLPANVVTQVRAWGSNNSGETNVPATLGDAIKVSAANSLSFALRANGEVVAWGYTGGSSSIVASLSEIVDIAGAIALRSDQRVVSLSSSSYTVPTTATGVVAIAASSSHYLALRADGTVVAWGYDGYGQCAVPAGLSNVVAIAAGGNSSAALLADGSVVVWGELRNLAAPAGLRPVDLAMGSRHLLARKADGAVVAWSNYSYASEATVPAGVTSAAAIAAAQELSFAIKPDGTLAAWGSSSALTSVPAGLDNVWAAAASGNHVLALRNAAGDAAPVITTQPSAQNVGAGMRATFSVTATGTAPLSYQWRRNGTPIAGATTATYAINAAATNDVGSYDVVVTNHRGSITSVAAALTVDVPPQITGGSSQRLTIAPGQPLALSVTATTTNGPLSYRWKKNNRVVAGANTASYSLASFTVADAGAYTVEVSDAAGRTSRRTSFVLPAFSATQLVGFGNASSYALTTLPSTISGPLASVAAGSSFNVALRLDGTVAAWGYNGSGETNVPAGLGGVVAVAAYGSYALALKSDGTVVMWGNSGNTTMVPPTGLSDVIAISAGSSHALALKSDGSVAAWGYTGYGATAVPAGLTDVVAVAAYDNYSLALKADGTVAAWGTASNGQISGAATQTGFSRLSGSSYSVVGVKIDGSVVGWGSNVYGQLTIPANVGPVSDVSLAAYHVLALRSDGSLAAWGTASNGETTIPANTTACFAVATGYSRSLALRNASSDLAPVITLPPQATTVVEGGATTLAVTATGSGTLTYQWRRDGVALAGATSSSLSLPSVTPTQAGAYDVVVTNHVGSVTSASATLTVAPLPTVTMTGARRNVVVPGGAVTFSVSASGTGSISYQWIRNGRPIPGATTSTLALTNLTAADSGWYLCVVTDANGARRSQPRWLTVPAALTQVTAWGGSGDSYNPTNVPAGLTDAVAITAGPSQSAVIRRDGGLVAWGRFSTQTSSLTLGGVVGAAATDSSLLTLHDDGTVRSWGSYSYVPGPFPDVVAVAAGGSNAALLRSDGTVVYWSIYNQNATTAAPRDIVAIAMGNSGAIGLKADGSVVSLTTQTVTIPDNLGTVVGVAAGYQHWLALRSDGTVVAWGGNTYGQTTVPTGLTNVVAVTASANSSFAVKADGTVVAWGSNQSGVTPLPANLAAVTALASNAGNHVIALRDASADTAPVISSAPVALVLGTGERGTFAVTSSSAGPLSYQWRKDGAPIAGATGASLALENVSSAAAGSYDVVVSNHIGSTTSAAATLTVENGPTFAQRPAERVSVTTGSELALTATVSATYAPVSYQWNKDNRPIAGATSASYSIPNFTFADAGAYTLVATDAHGHRAYATSFVQPNYGPTQVRSWGSSSTSSSAAVADVVDVSIGNGGLAGIRASGALTVLSSNSIGNSPALSDAVRISVGYSHALALRSNGLVVAWGSSSYGQTTVPASLRDIVAVAAGDNHSLALRADGTVAAWGYNNAGQSTVPANLSEVVAIAACSNTSAALKSDGSVVVWGDNYYGQGSVPAGLSGVVRIALGAGHALALKSDGTVVAWGSSNYGQVTVPANLTGVVEIAAGAWTSYARKSDGTIVVWGQNYYSQATIPAGLGTVHRLTAGSDSVAALRSTAGDLAPAITAQPANVAATLGNSYSFTATATGAGPLSYQWRKNGAPISYQTSATLTLYYVDSSAAATYDVVVSNHIGTVTSASATLTFASSGGPTLTLTGSSRLQPALGQEVVLAVNASGTGTLSYQWKKDGRVLAGATAATFNLASFANTDAGAYTLEVTDALSRVSRATIFVLPNYGATRVRSWGLGSWGQTIVPPGLADSIRVAAGDAHSLALSRDGRVAAWGANNQGQTAVPGDLASVVAIAAGGFHNLALKSDGTVVGWGASGTSQGTVPSTLKGVIAIAAGYTQSVALRDDGSVLSWGTNNYSAPVVSTGVAVAAGGLHALVLKADGTVLAWGDNTYGQTTVPAGLSNVVAIAAGTSHSVALKADGTVVAWGRNQLGQTSVPAGLSGVVALRAAADYCLALKADGTVVVWGDASDGVASTPADLGPTLDIATGIRHGLALVAGSTGSGPTITAHPQSENGREGATVTLRVTASGAGSLAYQWRRNGVALDDTATRSGTATDTLRLGGFSVGAVGNYTVVVSDANGSATSLTAVVDYEKTPQSIAFAALGDRDYSATALTLDATASSGLPVSLEVVSGPAQLNGNSLTLTAAGPVTVRATQAGDSTYAAAPPVAHTFTVGKATASVALGDLTAVFDGTPKSATAATNPGGLGVAITYNGWTPAPVAPGTYAVTATVTDTRFSGTATATFTIEKAAQTITFAGPADQPFTTAPLTLSATTTSGLEIVFSVVSGPATITGNSLQLLGSGTVTVRASQAGDENFLAAFVDRTFVVGTTFDAWRLNYFSAAELLDAAISGPNADPDGDGFVNLTEYALGTHPRANSAAAAPQMGLVAGEWRFTYSRPADRPDVTYTVEYSTNLTTWRSTGVTHARVTTTGGIETWRATYSSSGIPTCFFRLVVTH